MSSEDKAPGEACVRCLRRSWLIAELSPLLDYERGRPERLRELLALSDESLIDALAGTRRQSLRARHSAFHPDEAGHLDRLDTLCRHRDLYPKALSGKLPAAALYVGGGLGQLSLLTRRPLVAITGTRRPSHYGIRMARSLARGLAASAVTVVSGLQPGIAEAAHRGALELQVGTLAVTGDGLEFARSARSTVYEEIVSAGCMLSELQPKTRGRGWGLTACEDMLLALASVLVVIEAEETSRTMAAARLALEQGILVAAVPGRVENPLAGGPHALLLDGARLVRGPQDVLDLIYEGDTPTVAPSSPSDLGTSLPTRLRAVLKQVLSGNETPQSIIAGSTSSVDALAALSELELAGLIVRTADGRYVPGDVAPAQPRPARDPPGHAGRERTKPGNSSPIAFQPTGGLR
jgi:DNA processing protein